MESFPEENMEDLHNREDHLDSTLPIQKHFLHLTEFDFTKQIDNSQVSY